MDFAEIFSKITDFFSNLKETIVSFYEENKKLAIVISGLIVVILICIILLLCLAPSSKEKSKKSKAPVNQNLVLTETLQIPESPSLPDDYTISRKTESTWSDEESETWFTIPSEKEINALSQSNNNIINELLGAAP